LGNRRTRLLDGDVDVLQIGLRIAVGIELDDPFGGTLLRLRHDALDRP